MMVPQKGKASIAKHFASDQEAFSTSNGVATAVHAEPSPSNAPHFKQDSASEVSKGAAQLGQNMRHLTLRSTDAVGGPMERNVLHHLGANLLSFSAIRVCHPGPVARQR